MSWTECKHGKKTVWNINVEIKNQFIQIWNGNHSIVHMIVFFLVFVVIWLIVILAFNIPVINFKHLGSFIMTLERLKEEKISWSYCFKGTEWSVCKLYLLFKNIITSHPCVLLIPQCSGFLRSLSDQRSRKLLLKQIRSIRQICQSVEATGFPKSVWTDRFIPQPETLIGLIEQNVNISEVQKCCVIPI